MMEVLEDGILDEKINTSMMKQTRTNYKKYFDIVLKYNKICYEIRKKYVDKSVDSRKLFIITTMNEIHDSFQVVILLFERGLNNNAYVILRSMYEKLIDINYVIKNEDNYAYLFQKILQESIKQIDQIEEGKYYDIISKENISIAREFFKKDLIIKENGKEFIPLNLHDRAYNCGMKKEYFYYRYLCSYCHSSLVPLMNKMDYDEENNGVILNGNLNTDNIVTNIIMTYDCMSKAVNIICDFYNFVDIKEKQKNIDELFEKALKDDNII